MMRVPWTLWALLSAAVAVQATGIPVLQPLTIPQDPTSIKFTTFDSADNAATDLTEQASQLLEKFKQVMKTGEANYQIPVLDPATVHKLPIDVHRGPINARVVTTDAQVAGASDFVVKRITQIQNTNQLTVQLEVPQVDINGQFDMKGRVKIGFLSKTLNDQGPVQLNIKGIKLVATADVLANDDGSFNIRTVIADSWTYDDVKIQFDNLLGGGFLGTQANNLFNVVFPSIIESDRAKINVWLQNVIMKEMNKYLDGLAGKKSRDIETQVEEASEAFRAVMRSGRPDFNIPVMDPAVIPKLSIHVKRWPLDAQLVGSNIKVIGASDFKLNKISQIVGTNTVALDFEVPAVELACDYDLKSIVKVGFIKVNVNKQGPVTVSLEGLRAVATAELFDDTDGDLTLKTLVVQSWSYDNAAIAIEGLDGNGFTGFVKKTILNLINKLIPSLVVQPHVDDVSAWASRAGQRIIGRFLDAMAGRVVLPDLDKRAVVLLEQLKTVMKQGSEAYGMAVLDPAQIDEVPFTFNDALIDADIVAKKVEVAGLSDFTITKITQIEGTNKLTIDVAVGDVTGKGKFDVDGMVKLVVFKTPFKDSGALEFTIKGLKGTGTADLGVNADGNLYVKGLEISSWDFESTKATFENLANGGKAGKILNGVINKIIPSLVKREHSRINAHAEATIRTVLDQFLAGVAKESAVPFTLHVTDIGPEALDVLRDIAAVAARAGWAEAA